MSTHRVYLHSGRAIWPEHKPLSEVLTLRDTTPSSIWHGTYQGVPTAPGGSIFLRSWWTGRNRYDIDETRLKASAYARFISLDTGIKPGAEHDRTAAIVADLSPDYTLRLRFGHADQLALPDIIALVESLAYDWNRDEKLHAIIVEDKGSGTGVLQTIRASSDQRLASLLIPYLPSVDKSVRAQQASVWARNDCIELPYPRPDLFWLADFYDELLSFPRGIHDDYVDAFSQLVIYLERYLEDGYKLRQQQEHLT